MTKLTEKVATVIDNYGSALNPFTSITQVGANHVHDWFIDMPPVSLAETPAEKFSAMGKAAIAFAAGLRHPFESLGEYGRGFGWAKRQTRLDFENIDRAGRRY